MKAFTGLAPLFAVLMGVSALSYAAPRGPLMPLDENARRCELDDRDIEGDVQLDGRCFYEQALRIKRSNTTLDCQGAQLKTDDAYQIEIRNTIDNILVKNCYLIGGKGVAVRVRKGIHGQDHDALRAESPTNVVIQNISVRNSIGTGIYLHQYTVGVTVKDSIILDSSAPGLYLAPYGRNHQIINNLIEGSGHRKPDGFPRIGWYRREGIAIDGSSEHFISGNDIIDGALGGIMLYKNCWEHRYTNPKSRPRSEHARASVIENNYFARQPFGVWVASRQSRDLSQMGCGDPTPYENPIFVNEIFHPSFNDYPSAHADLYILSGFMASVWPDFAEENEIRGNTFEDISRGGVRVEDDSTVVADNLFIGNFDYIFVGAPFRARLAGQPIRGTQITGNSFYNDGEADFRSRLALIPDEHIDTRLESNFRACRDASGHIVRHGMTTEPRMVGGDGEQCSAGTLQCNDGQFEAADCVEMPADIDDEENLMATDRPTGGFTEPSSNAGGQESHASSGQSASSGPSNATDVVGGDIESGQSAPSAPSNLNNASVVDEEAGQGGTLGDERDSTAGPAGVAPLDNTQGLEDPVGEASPDTGTTSIPPSSGCEATHAPYPGVMTWLLPMGLMLLRVRRRQRPHRA